MIGFSDIICYYSLVNKNSVASWCWFLWVVWILQVAIQPLHVVFCMHYARSWTKCREWNDELKLHWWIYNIDTSLIILLTAENEMMNWNCIDEFITWIHFQSFYSIWYLLLMFQASLQFISAEHRCQWGSVTYWSNSIYNISQSGNNCWFWNNFGLPCGRSLWTFYCCRKYLHSNHGFYCH